MSSIPYLYQLTLMDIRNSFERQIGNSFGNSFFKRFHIRAREIFRYRAVVHLYNDWKYFGCRPHLGIIRTFATEYPEEYKAAVERKNAIMRYLYYYGSDED